MLIRKFAILVAGLLAAQTVYANQINLDWTMDAGSVQAIIFEALYNEKVADDESNFPMGAIQVNQNGELVVQKAEHAVACDSGSFGMLTVQSYKCTFSSADLTWSRASDSPQAVLYDALANLFAQEANSRFPIDLVHIGTNGELVVEDSNTRLACDSRSFGMTAVQSYSCKITLK